MDNGERHVSSYSFVLKVVNVKADVGIRWAR